MAVEEFRAKNGIMEIGKQSSLDQQELSEISSQALAARAETADAPHVLLGLGQLLESALEVIGAGRHVVFTERTVPHIDVLEEVAALR